jgi:hypothetical protein
VHNATNSIFDRERPTIWLTDLPKENDGLILLINFLNVDNYKKATEKLTAHASCNQSTLATPFFEISYILL